jgi:GNAT superfamily N-acetyltransferase
MPSLEIHPLSELRDEAAGLLAERYARQRAAEQLLPEIEDFAAHLPEEDGLVATRGGTAVAYLAGAVKNDIAHVGLAGVAATDSEAVRDLFAALAQRWGTSRFMAFVPASEAELTDAFFRLAFGCQAFMAVQEAAPREPVDFGGTIRESSPGDLRLLAELERELWRLQTEAPSYSGIELPPIEEHEEGWSDLWDDTDELWSFVAERNGEPIGGIVMYRRPTGDLRVPDDNVDLAFAATWPNVRGSGAGVALTHHVLTWAHEHGFRSVTTDWRSVNLLSSRFWPRRGFRPQYLRLYRAVP